VIDTLPSLRNRVLSFFLLHAARQRRGLPPDENDLWIAATALAMDAALVSRDSGFQAIEGLAVVEP